MLCVTSLLLSFLFAGLFAAFGHRVRKIDTTAGFSGLSYRVSCNNKNADENDVTISPKGFGKDVRDISFTIKGGYIKYWLMI